MMQSCNFPTEASLQELMNSLLAERGGRFLRYFLFEMMHNVFEIFGNNALAEPSIVGAYILYSVLIDCRGTFHAVFL